MEEMRGRSCRPSEANKYHSCQTKYLEMFEISLVVLNSCHLISEKEFETPNSHKYLKKAC